MKRILCFIMVLIIFILGIGNNTMAQTISTKDMEKILIDAVKKYTSLKYDESLELKIQEIKNSNKTDNEKYKELKKIYDNTKNGMNERQSYYGLLEKDMYVAYQFKKDLEEHPGKRISLGLSALVFNDEAMDYMLGVDPEKEKYKQMLKDFMKENKNYFECITYSNEIQSILSDSIAIAEDIASKEKLTKLYTSLENATSRSQIDEIIFKTTNDPIFKLEDGKYTFKSNLPKALDKAGDVLSIASTSLNGIQEICYAVSNIETYKLYEQFLRNICDYKKDGKYMMPYTMRGAAYELLYEMQGQFQAVLGNVLPLLQEYTKFGIDKVVDATKLTATGLLSSITTGISIGKFIGNVTLGMDEIVKSAAYVEGYAYLGELYSDILEKNKNTFVNNPTLKNAEQFKTNYDMLWSLRKKGEETYLSMVSFRGVWLKKDRDNLKSLTGYQEKETFCNNNIKMINSFQFIIKENIEPSIKITTKKSSMSVGDTFTFKVTKKGINKNIIWSVSNKKLATINSKTGKLTAKKAGTVTVIAKAGKKTDNYKITIKKGIDSLKYTLKEKRFEFKNSKNIVVYTNDIKYPYFSGSSLVAKTLNLKYQKKINEYKNNDMNFDNLYQTAIEFGREYLLPFYNDMTVTIMYNKNGYLSLLDTYNVNEDSAHPYTYIYGSIYNLNTGKEVNYKNILKGTDSQIKSIVNYYCNKTIGIKINDYEMEEVLETYILTKDGLCFYYTPGDAVPAEKIIIPYTDKNTCIISAKDILKKIEK